MFRFRTRTFVRALGTFVQFQPPPPRDPHPGQCFCPVDTRLSSAGLVRVCVNEHGLVENQTSAYEHLESWTRLRSFFGFFSMRKFMQRSLVALPIRVSIHISVSLSIKWYVYNVTGWPELSTHPHSSSSSSSIFSYILHVSFLSSLLRISMHFSPSLLASGLALMASGASAAPHEAHLGKRCTNSASDRTCWGDYDISTDYTTTVPDTGVTREV